MQKALLCTLPPAIDAVARPTAAQWRDRFEAAGIGDREQWNGVRIDASRAKLNVYAGNAAANAFLVDHLDAIAGCVADALNAAIPLDLVDRQVGVRSGVEQLWAYRIPRLVAEKKSGDWAPHFATPVDPALKAKTLKRIEAGLRRELATWNRLPEAIDGDTPFLAIADMGRAVVVPAIEAARSGHGHRVNVLVRRDVVLMSYWRFEGNLFVGPLSSLGFGRITRFAPPEMLSTELQRDLMKIIPESTEAA